MSFACKSKDDLMDSERLKLLQNLSGSNQETLILTCLIHPDTKSVKINKDRAAPLIKRIHYSRLSENFVRIVTVMNANLRFEQLQTQDICIE